MGTIFKTVLILFANFTLVASASPYLPLAKRKAITAFAPTVIASSGPMVVATGYPSQNHIFYASNTGKWWMAWVNDTAHIRMAYSADLKNWTAATPFAIAKPLLDGSNLALAYKSIGGVDVVHFSISYQDGVTTTTAHLRATLNATSASFGTEFQVGLTANGSDSPAKEDGPAVTLGADNRVYRFTSAWADDGVSGSGYRGNFDVQYSNVFDTGASWTNTNWSTPNHIGFADGYIAAHWGAPFGSTGAITIQTNGEGITAAGNTKDLWYSVTTNGGAAWSSPTSLLTSSFATAIHANDWQGIRLSNTDIRLVYRSGTNTYGWRQFNGTTWANPAASIPNQTSKAGSGVAMVTDGTNIWLFVIDSAAGNAIKSAKFNGTSWGSWVTVESSFQVRNNLVVSPNIVGGAVGLIYTQTNGPNNDVLARGYQLP